MAHEKTISANDRADSHHDARSHADESESGEEASVSVSDDHDHLSLADLSLAASSFDVQPYSGQARRKRQAPSHHYC